MHFFYSFLRGSPAGLSLLMDPGSLALLPALFSLFMSSCVLLGLASQMNHWRYSPCLRVQLGTPTLRPMPALSAPQESSVFPPSAPWGLLLYFLRQSLCLLYQTVSPIKDKGKLFITPLSPSAATLPGPSPAE